MKTATYTKSEPLTNEQIAKLIGLTHSAVSRLRSSDRQPSIATMYRVESAFGWPASEQLETRMLNAKAWAEGFETALDNFTT